MVTASEGNHHPAPAIGLTPSSSRSTPSGPTTWTSTQTSPPTTASAGHAGGKRDCQANPASAITASPSGMPYRPCQAVAVRAPRRERDDEGHGKAQEHAEEQPAQRAVREPQGAADQRDQAQREVEGVDEQR